MRADQLDAYAPALLGLMSVCGVASNKAPGLLRSRLQAMSRLPQLGRAELFRAVLRACRRSLSHAPGGEPAPANQDFPRNPVFEALPIDVRAALFLLVEIELGLRETAFILETDPNHLAKLLDTSTQALADG